MLYEINDGIRRAKAADLTGSDAIRATVDGGRVEDVPIRILRVPRGNTGKHVIDITSERAEERWLDTYVRTLRGEVPPPIDVRTAPQSNGVRVRDVPVVKQGRPVDPLTGGMIVMVKEDKLTSALYALHLILVELRSMSFEGQDAKVVGEILDWAEAMPFLIAKEDEDRTEAFRSHLLALAERCPRFQRVVTAFDAGRGFYG